ncbi:GntR family transcriptional regulator, partial [Bradyrhizobium sp.]
MQDENLTTAHRIADVLTERIVSGALPPDAPLRQDHIAREFNSSHVPVREAFRQL